MTCKKCFDQRIEWFTSKQGIEIRSREGWGCCKSKSLHRIRGCLEGKEVNLHQIHKKKSKKRPDSLRDFKLRRHSRYARSAVSGLYRNLVEGKFELQDIYRIVSPNSCWSRLVSYGVDTFTRCHTSTLNVS